MITDTLRVIINNSFKKIFYEKEKKKKAINGLTIFFISYESSVKTFLKWIIN